MNVIYESQLCTASEIVTAYEHAKRAKGALHPEGVIGAGVSWAIHVLWMGCVGLDIMQELQGEKSMSVSRTESIAE